MGYYKSQNIPRGKPKRKQDKRLSFEDYWFIDYPITPEFKATLKEEFSKAPSIEALVLNLSMDGFKLSLSWVDSGSTCLVSLTCVHPDYPDAGGIVTGRSASIHKSLFVVWMVCQVLEDAGGWRVWRDSQPLKDTDPF